jgi:hypothetical protein
VEVALDRLVAMFEIAERVVMDPAVLAPLRKRINACKRAALSMPLPQQPGFASEALAIEEAIENVAREVRGIDLDVPIGTFRRKLSPETSSPETLARYAHELAVAPFDGDTRQQRFELVVLHALYEEKSAGMLVRRPDPEVERLLSLVLEGFVGDAARRAEVVAHFDDARRRLSSFRDAEQMFVANFDRDILETKRGLGDALLDREVLEAVMRFEAAYRACALALPASSHKMSLAPAPKKPPEAPDAKPRARQAVLSAHGLSAVLARAIDEVQAR